MSLVERALRKMQVPRDGHKYDATTSTGTTSSAAARKVGEKPRSGRTVHFNRPAIRAAGLLPPEHQERQISGQYRQIKRPLIQEALKAGANAIHDSRLIMVTSAMPGDGKTFTSINLALSIAKERDFDVVLVDADVAKPHVSRLFGLEREPGLLDALYDSAIDLESLILQTDIPGLGILPAGQQSETAAELLGSQRMKDVVRGLQGRDASRLVVIDSPPLLLTNESRILAGSVGQVVVVVRAGKTAQKDLLEALSYLDSSRQAIGLVMNQSLDTSPSQYFAYGDSSQQQTQDK